jgi:hypothetical protein
MDFVVSKVAMSICALMVVAILGGVFNEGAFLDVNNELENIVDDFCSVADMIALAGAESSISWLVPFSSDGDPVSIKIDGILVRAESGSESAVSQPVSPVRTWRYDGRSMNATQLAEMDATVNVLKARSGQSITLESRMVSVDNQNRMFVFASYQV